METYLIVWLAPSLHMAFLMRRSCPPGQVVAAAAIGGSPTPCLDQVRKVVTPQLLVAFDDFSYSTVAGSALAATVDRNPVGHILDAGGGSVVAHKVGRALLIKVESPSNPRSVVGLGHDLGGNGVVPSIRLVWKRRVGARRRDNSIIITQLERVDIGNHCRANIRCSGSLHLTGQRIPLVLLPSLVQEKEKVIFLHHFCKCSELSLPACWTSSSILLS